MAKKIILLLAWLAAVGAGFAVILNYQSRNGAVGEVPRHWPAGARIVPDRDRATLVMFAHPRCPCTRASLEELNRLLTKVQGRVAVQVYFYRPGAFPVDWAQTGLWRSAAAMPDVTVHEDLDGAQARLFGAETSGQVVLFDPRGNLLFQGGITAGRGHAGNNVGEAAVAALLAGNTAGFKPTPVYGCSLLGECEAPTNGVAR